MHRQSTWLKSMIRPMYYDFPESARAYELRNQYGFGTELMVCPITSPADEVSGMGSVKAWIPKGIYTDLFTGKTYSGDRVTVLNRSLEECPVLAKPGAIVPLAVMEEGSNSVENPKVLELIVCPGGNNTYTIFEDDGNTDGYLHGKAFETVCTLNWDSKTFCLEGRGDLSVMPEKREYRITFRGFDRFTPEGEGVEKVSYDAATRSVTVHMQPVSPDTKLTLSLAGAQRETNADAVERCTDFMMMAHIPTAKKVGIKDLLVSGKDTITILEELLADGVDARTVSCLSELLIN
jgi:hypothetical protein